MAYTAWKATKRRAMQRTMETFGMAEKTTDEQMDEHTKQFNKMATDLNQLGTGMFSTLQKQREFYENAAKLSDVVDSFYNGAYKADWQGEEVQYQNERDDLTDASRFGKERWKYLNDVVRRSMAKVVVDQALTPLREFVNETVPKLNESLAERNAARTDFDLYRRRIAALEKRGKSGDEVTVTEAKRDRARDRFEVVDANAKDLLLKAKIERDDVLETATITIAACQLELMYMTANYLEEAIIAFPKHKVDFTRNAIREIVNVGGPELAVDKLSGIAKAYKLATGQALLSDFEEAERKAKELHDMQEARRQEVASARSIQLGGDDATWVIAEFDCDGEAEDELSFKIGDKIKLTKRDDSGWWEGTSSVSGATGLFPSNYVRMATQQEL